MEYNEFMERFMRMAKECAGDSEAIVTVTNSDGQSCSERFYFVEGNTITYSDELVLHPEMDELCWDAFDHFERGIHIMRF